MNKIALFLLLTGCMQTCYQKLSNDPLKESQKICLTADGTGRIILDNEKYRFGFESLLERAERRFAISMNFPLVGEEFMELTWKGDKIELNSELETRILESSNKAEAESLHNFIELWSKFIKDIIELQQMKNDSLKFKWAVVNNELVGERNSKKYKVFGKFYNAQEDYFSKMKFTHIDKKTKKQSQIELIVSKCLNKSENQGQ